MGRQSKERRKEYRQRPDVKAKAHDYNREYFRRPEIKERQRDYMKHYRDLPENRERKRAQQRVWYSENRETVLAKRRFRYIETSVEVLRKQAEERRQPEIQERRRRTGRIYRMRPAVKARKLATARRPDQVEKKQAYDRRRLERPGMVEANRARVRAYHLRPEVRAKREAERRARGMRPRGMTQPEAEMERLLNENFHGDWEYTGDGRTTLAGCRPDFFNVNGKKAIIEVYGCYYHNCPTCGLKPGPRSPERDEERIGLFEKMGFKPLVVWQHELKDKEQVIQRIQAEFYV